MTAKIEELVQQVEALRDPAARTLAIDLIQEVMKLHAQALERILQLAPEAAEAMGTDDLVSSVLALHGLHPHAFEARLERAIERLERHFDSRGARLQLISANPDEVRVRFTGTRPGAAAAARQLIEDVIYEAVPEAGGLIVEGTEEEQSPGFVPLAALLATK